ncbi:MAG: AAA family ATPase, partial [Pseudoclavibacter sp.]
MRIETVRMAGIGPFRSEQHVDFERFAGDGLFLIAGKTGSGKSSILDAIVYALYGQLPRYEGHGGERAIRSDHAAPSDASFVEAVFEVERGRYRVRRSPEFERPKARGTGTTTSKAEAQLDEWREGSGPDADGEWVGVAAKLREVGNALTELLPLSVDQFLQVVLLAQNRFHEFLVAESKDRTHLLRALFATHRFDDLATLIDERRRNARTALDVASATVGGHEQQLERLAGQVAHAEAAAAPAGHDGADDGDTGIDGDTGDADGADAAGDAELGVATTTPVVGNRAGATDANAVPAPGAGLLARIEATTTRAAAARAAAGEREAAAGHRLETARQSYARADGLRERQRRRDAAAAALAELDARSATIDDGRRRLRDATLVAPVMPLIDADADAASTRADAERGAVDAIARDAGALDSGARPGAAVAHDGAVSQITGELESGASAADVDRRAIATRLASEAIAETTVEAAIARRDAATERIGVLTPALADERGRGTHK